MSVVIKTYICKMNQLITAKVNISLSRSRNYSNELIRFVIYICAQYMIKCGRHNLVFEKTSGFAKVSSAQIIVDSMIYPSNKLMHIVAFYSNFY